MSSAVDKKTCMLRVGSSGEGKSSRWMYVMDQINKGKDIPSEKLSKWFKQIPIEAKDFAGSLTREQHLLVKAAYGMMQIACIATKGTKVGVFLRPEKEQTTGNKKITSGYSLMRCWSPVSTIAKDIQSSFEKRTGFMSGHPIIILPFGLGYNELLEASPNNVGPGYLFMVHKAVCMASDFPHDEQGATDKKSGEIFIGFFDPKKLYAGKSCYQKNTIKFKGRMDNLILRSLALGEKKTESGELAVFNQASWIYGKPVNFENNSELSNEEIRIIAWLREIYEKQGPAFCQNALYDLTKIGIGALLSKLITG